MRLEFATNQMIKIFDNNMKFVTLKKAIYEIQDDSAREEIAIKLEAFNTVYKVLIDMCNDSDESVEDSILNDTDFILNAFEMYQNVISTTVFTRCLKINFKKLYKEKYVQTFRADLLNFWNESTTEKNNSKEDRTFIKMFDEIHNYTLKFNKDLFSKDVRFLKGLVRGAKGNHINDYEWMIPKDEYAGFNRWNPEKKAFLYLGWADSESPSKINNSIETCCEELRMKNSEIVTICRFKTVKANGKLLDFSIDESLVDIQEEIINESINNELEKIINDEKLIEKCKLLSESGENRKLKRLIKSKVKNSSDRKKIERYISTMFIHDIVEAIFLPVDEDKDSYLPFHLFANYLIEKGYCGVIHKSTRMDLLQKKGKNVILFNPIDAIPIEGTMRLFTKINDKIIEAK